MFTDRISRHTPLPLGAALVFAIPEGAKLTRAQLASFQAGTLYLSADSIGHPSANARPAEVAAPGLRPTNLAPARPDVVDVLQCGEKPIDR